MTHTDIARPENSHIWERETHEHYVEPKWCSRRLFDVEKFDGPILDPACGFGHIPESAQVSGHISLASDVVDRGYLRIGTLQSFFELAGPFKNIVTNPPFDICGEFANHALKITTSKIAMIWLVRRLPAARWLEQTPLARIWLLTPRPSMPPGHVITRGEKSGGGKQDFCWLVWDKAHSGPAEIKWLRREAA